MWKNKWFGYWKQDGDYYNNCPDLTDWIGVDSVTTTNIESIINYLDSGGFVAASPSEEVCHLCGKIIDSSKVILTDGVWMWPKSLSHYLHFHKLHLPEEFIKHLKDNEFDCPLVEDDFDMLELEHP